ncbi:hypothetical protein HY625_00570 [Candidatus Uhrbacteria bacterium]|nr:hypothetical protein [Candidatus Uhrbacteria bacterium]
MFLFPSLALPLALLVIFGVILAVLMRRQQRFSRALHRQLYEISVLKELGERVGYSLNTQKIVDVIARSLVTFIPYSAVSYIFVEPEKLLFNCNLRESVSRFFVDDVRRRMLASLGALLDRDLKDDSVDESLSGEILDDEKKSPVRSFFNIPLVIAGAPVGVLTVASTEPGLYREEEMTILYKIVNQASSAVSKLQAVLTSEQEHLNAMVASMADGVIMVDTEWRTIVLNATLKNMLGIAHDRPVFPDVLKTLQDRIDLRQKITESMEKNETVLVPELEYASRFFQVIISPVRMRQLGELIPFGTVVLFHDMTKEKELERVRDTFTSMMVHDLKAPLDGIRKITELLERPTTVETPNEKKQFLDLIQKNASNMLLLVSDLLDVSRMEEGKFPIEKVRGDLADVVRDACQSLVRLAAEKRITLTWSVLQTVPPALFDRRRIAQVMNNFLSNALKFTPPGGSVRVALFAHRTGGDVRIEASDAHIDWNVFPLDARLANLSDQLVIAVTDTGNGIPQDKIGRLFTKWQRIDGPRERSEGGTGLGLVIVKGIVEAHGGSAGVLSEDGKGSIFYCTIPTV